MTVGLRRGRWAVAITAVAAAGAGVVLLGLGDAGPESGPKASFTLGSHEPQMVVGAYDAPVPLLTPAFKNNGPEAASRGVVVRVSVTNAQIDETAPKHRNCYYSDDYRTAFCEFADAVPVGGAFETTGPVTERINARYHELEAAYTYAVWPLGSPPPHTPDYRAHYRQGTGDALGLKSTTLSAGKRGGELRFRWKAYAGPADWSVSPITIRGRVGEEVEVDVPRPQATPEPAPERMRVQLPLGTRLVKLTQELAESKPSEVSYCSRDREDENIYCTNPNWNVLRVRIDRRVDGAEGRVTVPEPLNGDTKPANNSAPIKVEITGTA
ncbi:hypothetical protein [Streptomyces bicolor]|uniref:hypothetical protein n=1 Tax=Streptomyces bicolor TaxID=66874 RepID=UPI00131B11BE|nr:hypothetical protein [Streptomyces bicolor]